jgi:molybdate transport system substrate-binding protein
MAMTMFAGCGNKDQASAGETNTVASADAEKSSETEGAEVNAEEYFFHEEERFGQSYA